MATVSSHILDSVFGGSAVGIRCRLFHLANETSKTEVFDVLANEQGRIVESLAISETGDYELVFYSGEYFRNQSLKVSEYQLVEQVVIRFYISDINARYHIPVMLSAHSYSVWWSKLPD